LRKLFNCNLKKPDPIDDKKIQLFLEKGISKFYIPRDQKEMFYDHFLNLLEGLEYKYNPKTVEADLAVEQ